MIYASWAIASITISGILENREEDKRGVASVIIIDTLSRTQNQTLAFSAGDVVSTQLVLQGFSVPIDEFLA